MGFVVIALGAAHLVLNLSIMFLPFAVASEKLQKIMAALCSVFGPIAIREDRHFLILCVKVLVSASFLTGGIGVVRLKEWGRKLLFLLLGLRILYALAVSLGLNIFHLHFVFIIGEGLFFFIYFTRPNVKKHFS